MKLSILTTGGTIDKVYFDARSEFEVGESVIDAILGEAQVSFEYSITQLMQKDSLELTDDDRTAIAAAVRGCADRFILITHGTDTMTHTAEALGDVGDKVVVLTGALRPARFRMTDAVFNVGMACAAVQSASPGVYIAMNGRIFPAGEVIKNLEMNRFERKGETL